MSSEFKNFEPLHDPGTLATLRVPSQSATIPVPENMKQQQLPFFVMEFLQHEPKSCTMRILEICKKRMRIAFNFSSCLSFPFSIKCFSEFNLFVILIFYSILFFTYFILLSLYSLVSISFNDFESFLKN